MTENIQSPTAEFLRYAIERSGLTQARIAREAGLARPNMLSMMKKGETKVPIGRIPTLAAATGANAQAFLRTALAEYHPAVWEAIKSTFGGILTGPEQDLLLTFRLCDQDGEIRMSKEDVQELMRVFERLEAQAKRRGLTLTMRGSEASRGSC